MCDERVGVAQPDQTSNRGEVIFVKSEKWTVIADKGEPTEAKGEFEHNVPENLAEAVDLVGEKEAFGYFYKGWKVAMQAKDRDTLKGKEPGVISKGRAISEAVKAGKFTPEQLADLEALIGVKLS